MNRIRHLRHLAAILTGLAAALLGLSAAAPGALADPRPHPPPGWNKHPPLPAHTQAMAAGGMPGWRIALIAAGVVLLAALAVTVYRIWAARRATPSAA